jgi:hypothetical protein
MYFNFSQTEWGPQIELKIDSVTNNKNNLLIIKAKLKVFEKNNFAELVSEIKNSDTTVYWSGTSVNDFLLKNDSLVEINHLILLQDINTKDFKNLVNKSYIWNKNKQKLNLYSLEYIVLQGYKNPYALYYDIKSN